MLMVTVANTSANSQCWLFVCLRKTLGCDVFPGLIRCFHRFKVNNAKYEIEDAKILQYKPEVATEGVVSCYYAHIHCILG